MRITERKLRRLIRQVINESMGTVDKLANFDFNDEDDYSIDSRSFGEFASRIYSLVVCFEEGDYEDIHGGLTKLNLDFEGLKRLCAEMVGKSSLVSSMMGYGYVIDKRVFDALGFTQNDIDKMLEHNREHNEGTSSYDDNLPGAVLRNGEITFNIDY